MNPQEYAAMMESARRHAKAAFDSGGCIQFAIREWQKINGPLSKGEIRLVTNRAMPRVIGRRRKKPAA